jgi:hypothetical protein
MVSFGIMAAFLALFSLCFAREAALFLNYRTEGLSYADARQEFARLASSTQATISVSESLWVLVDDFSRIRIVERGSASGPLMVLQQTQRQALTPPEIPGYHLTADNFVSHPPRWFGRAIARTVPGYSFAVFTRGGLAETFTR